MKSLPSPHQQMSKIPRKCLGRALKLKHQSQLRNLPSRPPQRLNSPPETNKLWRKFPQRPSRQPQKVRMSQKSSREHHFLRWTALLSLSKHQSPTWTVPWRWRRNWMGSPPIQTRGRIARSPQPQGKSMSILMLMLMLKAMLVLQLWAVLKPKRWMSTTALQQRQRQWQRQMHRCSQVPNQRQVQSQKKMQQFFKKLERPSPKANCWKIHPPHRHRHRVRRTSTSRCCQTK
mmetsp:Transcript_53175/g.113598  ORF Transcript_53175/g.113598 Transcript_53175/m.113598 type:complete len:231 (+) Transcript_53175:1619-2311(+)